MNITVFKQNVPFWPSISYIQPVLLKAILAAFPKAKIVDLLDKNLKPSLEDDLWIFLPGSVQIPTLQWLSKNSNNPMSRPRSLFFLNAEAAKLCIQLFHFRHLFREDDVWSVTCAAEKKLIDRWFPGNSNTVLNYYPVDTATFFPTKKSFRKKFGLPEDKQLILYSGRLSLQKNISFVLDFILRFPKLHLVLCGDIDSLGVPHIAGAPVSQNHGVGCKSSNNIYSVPGSEKFSASNAIL
jgi:glycosyltransferase involved in cell wall biosynthesis